MHGNGTLQCLLDGAHADAAVLTEPHPDHFTLAQVGVCGSTSTSAASPPTPRAPAGWGCDALDAALSVLDELRELERELNVDPPAPYDEIEHPINLNPGVVTRATGRRPSRPSARCRAGSRCTPGRTPWGCERASRRRWRARARPRPSTRRWCATTASSARARPSPADAPLVVALADAYTAVHGEAPGLEATTATTDARHFVRRGIPAVCFGPRAERIHGIDERVSL